MRNQLYLLALSGSLLAHAASAQSAISSSTRSDSLTSTASYNKKLVLPIKVWGPERRVLPASQALVYGSSVGTKGSVYGHYMRLANLSTGKVVLLDVKPSMPTKVHDAFCYALPPGRYALYKYEYALHKTIGAGYGATSNGMVPGGGVEYYKKETYEADLYKALGDGLPLRARRYEFVVAPGQLYYLGTWDVSKSDQPVFRNEKLQLDEELHGIYKYIDLEKALVALPQ
ncbi:hypothetical protein Q5H93_22440 [Hymenobacter sp. ASUV-10]|uniref:DUF4450 domain-containing protein n=1 Tax=Hymenobacter aranciens TaxID=3063996 RepID=A0ABT9BGX0_9BACT|nr:hypothetical protein [Hymenobacter sp. ASUV-10]MDO7877515.1 hypothetical protein [Hymenobacter sp. ASUV-10]